MKEIRRKIATRTFMWSRYGGESMCLVLSCGHTKLIARLEPRQPKLPNHRLFYMPQRKQK